MASPNSTFTELVSTTFRKHRREIMDNVSNRNALLKRLMTKGNYEKEDGGLTIVTPLDYAENSTYQRYSDWDTLNIQASDVISAAEYQWRQIALNVVSSGRELRINSGESKIIKLAKAKIKNALRTFNNNFSNDIYSDGTAT
ncbi:MAG: phage major capsid protein, partial [Aliifodinibius sp.]|nr:phage major capsid protein [Fodinibius sp.]NIY26951.1 phage major capsid protein [Fodinibius sp.]